MAMAMWLCGYVAMAMSMAMWLCGYVAMWLCGYGYGLIRQCATEVILA